MIEKAHSKSPVVVGPVSVDVLYSRDVDLARSEVFLRFGGVCHNIVCTLGTMGLSPVFVSPKFTGEIGQCVGTHLRAQRVNWVPLRRETSLSLFTADIDRVGAVSNEVFIDGGAVRALHPAALSEHADIFRGASAIVSCSDLSTESLDELMNLSCTVSAPFCVVSTSVEEVGKFRAMARRPDVVSLNIGELQTFAPVDGTDLLAVARAATALVSSTGACIVTLGAIGALVCTPGSGEAFFQSVPAVKTRSTVGAGDVLFSVALASRLSGSSWADALHIAAGHVAAFIQADPDCHGQYSRVLAEPLDLPPSERYSL